MKRLIATIRLNDFEKVNKKLTQLSRLQELADYRSDDSSPYLEQADCDSINNDIEKITKELNEWRQLWVEAKRENDDPTSKVDHKIDQDWCHTRVHLVDNETEIQYKLGVANRFLSIMNERLELPIGDYEATD